MAEQEKITKTVMQYSDPLPEETMEFLRGIAADYGKVKKHVYSRYAGIGNLDRLTPAFDIMAQVRHSGLRTELNLPSAYFDPAIIDAVADIKAVWAVTKNKIRTRITANENLSGDDRAYLRTVLKLNGVYAAVLNRREYEMPRGALGLDIDVKRLNNLLCRLTRRCLPKIEAGSMDYFSIAPCGYAYKDGSIYIASRVRGKRMEIPLKDRNTCSRQIRISVREDSAVLALPVEAKIRKHTDYHNTVYVHIGFRDMFTLSNGNVYGQSLGMMSSTETSRLDGRNRKRAKVRAAYRESMEAGEHGKAGRIEANNLGTDKYRRQKAKARAKAESYINAEINRMLRTEKPGTVVVTRPLTIGRAKLPSKSANRKLAGSYNGYIRERLSYKCRVNAIELVEINSKGTGSMCSACGAEGKRTSEGFVCPSCGYRASISANGAANIRKKYLAEQNKTGQLNG